MIKKIRKEELFWDILIILVFIGGVLYVHGMNETLENQGCKAYWSNYSELDVSNPSLEFKANASFNKEFSYVNETDLSSNFSEKRVLETNSKR